MAGSALNKAREAVAAMEAEATFQEDPEIAALSLTLLALAEEQRTANLIALSQVGSSFHIGEARSSALSRAIERMMDPS